MYTLIIFSILCFLQYGFYLWKKSEVEDYQSIAVGVADFSGLSKRKAYKRSLIFLVNMVSFFKRFLLAGIVLVVIVNGFISLILGSIIHLIVSLLT